MKTKEFTIEEKAKAYDEAINKIMDYRKGNTKMYSDVNKAIDYLFPELAVSEDERIRKGAITSIKRFIEYTEEEDCAPDIKYMLIKNAEKQIAWLEKQGEQKPAEWSKEDERNFDIIYGIIYNSCNAEDASRLIAWLKSLKDRDYQGKVDELNDTISSLNTLEGKKVDWDFMLHEYWDISPKICVDCLESATMTKDEMINFAKHFFELGLKAQKG